MNDFDCKGILPKIKSDFGALFKCRSLGDGSTLEIITPHLYPDSSFVSVFLTKRGDRLIVTDGGKLSEFLNEEPYDLTFLSNVLSRLMERHDVKSLKGRGKFFYKETTQEKLLSSLVFDLCNFLVGVSSAVAMSLSEEEETDTKSFRNQADTFFRIHLPKTYTLKLNYSLPHIKEATFSAAVFDHSSRLWLFMYLTGSTFKYFQLSVSNAIVNARFAQKSSLSTRIEGTIPLINNKASGYQPRKLHDRLGMLTEVTGKRPILWSEKETLTPLLS